MKLQVVDEPEDARTSFGPYVIVGLIDDAKARDVGERGPHVIPVLAERRPHDESIDAMSIVDRIARHAIEGVRAGRKPAVADP